MKNKTDKKIREMEEILEKYGDMVERIEDSEKMMLVDCKNTPNGIEFDFILREVKK